MLIVRTPIDHTNADVVTAGSVTGRHATTPTNAIREITRVTLTLHVETPRDHTGAYVTKDGSLSETVALISTSVNLVFTLAASKHNV